jgi:hypothetical protein
MYPWDVPVVGWYPTLGAGIISPAGVSVESEAHLSAPDDHLIAARPHCGMKGSTSRRASCAGGCPTVGAGVILRAGVKIAGPASDSAPDDHFTTSPDCRVTSSGSGWAGEAGSCPTVRKGIVSPPCIKYAVGGLAAPDDHFTAGPDCRVAIARVGCADNARGPPTVGGRVISAAGVQKMVVPIIKKPAPYDHFSAGPDCCVRIPARRRVGGASGCPAVGGRIVSAASV